MASGARTLTVTFAGDTDQLSKASKDAAKDIEKVDKAASDMGETFDGAATTSATVAGGLGDLGGALSQVGGPLGSLGTGMELLAPSIMGITGAADLASVAMNSLNLTNIKTAASTAWTTIQTKAAAVASKAWAAVQWVLNAALSANPIAIVVLAIAALVAGVILAYKNSETFRDIVQAVWSAIQTAISFAWENILKPIFNAWLDVFRVLGAAVVWLWEKAVKPAFDGIVAAAKLMWAGLSAAFDLVRDGIAFLVGLVTGLPSKFVAAASGLWNFISDGFVKARDAAVGLIDGFITTLTGLPAKAGAALAGLWGGITAGAKAAVNGAITILNTLIGAFNIVIRGYNKIPLVPDFPEIPPIPPLLASGAVVSRAMLAVVGEGPGREIVTPEKLLRQIVNEGPGGGGGGTTVNVTVNVPPVANPAETGRAVAGALRSYFSAGGRLTVPA